MQIKFDKILGCLRELDEGTGGGGTSGDTIITGTVATYAALPLASGYTGKYYIVDTATGTWLLGTLKKAGLYKSNGTTWVYIDNVPETTSLSDGTTVITGTNIILEGTNGVVTTTDVNNNKITISGPNIPDQLSDLSDDSTHRLVTDTEKTTWNNKLDSYTETDPVFLASQANNITSTHITTLNNTSGTNTGDETQSSIITKLGTAWSSKYDSSNFVAGTNYLAPNGNGSQLTNLNARTLTRVGFSAYGSSTSFLATTHTPVTFTNEVEDTNSAFNGTVFTVPTGQGGLYQIAGSFCFSSNASAYNYIISLGINGTSPNYMIARGYIPASMPAGAAGVTVINLNAGDTVRMLGYCGVANSAYTSVVGFNAFSVYKMIGA